MRTSSTKRTADPLALPKFLARPRTEESRRLADAVVRSGVSREWVMPDLSRPGVSRDVRDFQDLFASMASTLERGETMSKKKQPAAEPAGEQEIRTQNPELPVKMELTPERGSKMVKDFDDLEKFLVWFNPAIHEVTGSVADAAITLVTVRERPTLVRGKLAKGDPKLAGANAVSGAVPKSPGAVGGRGAVIKKGDGPGRGGARPGAVRHGCTVDGRGPYGSVYKAFLEERLDVSKHTKFRAELKASPSGEMSYSEAGKSYGFKLVEAK